jgi:hypothetical protein
MKTWLETLFEIVGTAGLADFVAGFVHWFEDAYVREDTPVIGALVGKPNVIHHHLPRYFTRFTWWHSSRDLLLISSLIVLAAGAIRHCQHECERSSQMGASYARGKWPGDRVFPRSARVANTPASCPPSCQSQRLSLLPDHQSRQPRSGSCALLGCAGMVAGPHDRAATPA